MESRRSRAEEIVAEYVRAHPELKCHLDPSSSVVMRYERRGSKQRIVHERARFRSKGGPFLNVSEAVAVVWRNAQRARSELLGLWFFRSFSNLRKLIVTARQIITQWGRRVRVRNELITLSDGDLRDIGWTKAEVEAERRKPFWRA